MEAISQIGNGGSGGTIESSSRDLRSYRNHPAPSINGVVRRGVPTSRESTQSDARVFSDVLRNGSVDTTRTNRTGRASATGQNNFFRLGSGGNNGGNGTSFTGSLFGLGEQSITNGQSDAALARANGAFSERFVDANPVFSPPPRELPNGNGGFPSDVDSNSIAGSVGSAGDLSQDLLRALQRYRVAAEIQG